MGDVHAVAWSSCSRFIVVKLSGSMEVLDAVTLERLHTFAHQSLGTGWLSFSPDSRSFTWIDNNDNRSITWDLQTGGRISAAPSTPNTPPPPRHSSMQSLWHFPWNPPQYLSSTYSMDSKIVAVARRNSENSTVTTISTYNLLSGTHIYSHRVSEGRIAAQIWTHGENFRFAAVKPWSITIWQVGFTSEHTLAEIESLPAPDDTGSKEHLFLPTLSRLAFILRGAVLIWDARDSKFLLNSMDSGEPLGGLSFSSDGRFLACEVTCGKVTDHVVHLWKESPAGYLPHQKLVPGLATYLVGPLLSPDGESIITLKDDETQLWRTTDPINPPSSVPPQPDERSIFLLAFSPDKSFIATGRLGENIVTVVDLKSGDPRLIVDTGMEIRGLGVTADTVLVVGEGKIVTWNLPAGDLELTCGGLGTYLRGTLYSMPGRTFATASGP